MTYDEQAAGDFVADMLAAGVVLVENKALQTLVEAQEVQLVNYLSATDADIELLLNFSAASLQL